MNSLSNLLCFELTKLGAAYQIIQSEVDNALLYVFEISPTPGGAILILTSDSAQNAQLSLKKIIANFKEYILFSTHVTLAQPNVLEAYLSQNTPLCAQQIAFFETQSVVEGFQIAAQLDQSNVQVLDFRVLRSTTTKVIIIATDNELKEKIAPLKRYQPILIEQPSKVVKSFFEIQNQ